MYNDMWTKPKDFKNHYYTYTTSSLDVVESKTKINYKDFSNNGVKKRNHLKSYHVSVL